MLYNSSFQPQRSNMSILRPVIIQNTFHLQQNFSGSSNTSNKVFIIIRNRKMFCDNPDCSHTTFAERFDLSPIKRRKPVVLRMNCTNVNKLQFCCSIKSSKGKCCGYRKSTVCNLLKKRNTGCWQKDSNSCLHWWFCY